MDEPAYLNLTTPFTVQEFSWYAEERPRAFALLSMKLGLGRLWANTGSWNCWQQDFISLRIIDSFLWYLNVPAEPMKLMEHLLMDNFPLGEFLDANEPCQYQWSLLPPRLTSGIQVDLYSHFQLLRRRLHGTDDCDVPREATLRYLDEIYYYHPPSPVASSVIPTLVAKHAYLSFQARALNVHPPPPRRILERVELDENGTLRIDPNNSSLELYRQCLEDMRKDLPVMYQQVRKAVEQMSRGWH